MTGKSVIKISLQLTKYKLVLISFNNIICNWFNNVERQILSLIIEPELRWTSSSRARSRRSSGNGHRKTEESEKMVFFTFLLFCGIYWKYSLDFLVCYFIQFIIKLLGKQISHDLPLVELPEVCWRGIRRWTHLPWPGEWIRTWKTI